ncbi:MAG TPA: DUF3488 and transglutaminase-like domain-containing protein [Bryobacteraceae bacterium]|nr:DUF3488 and transglutaminase-like domain-containing protein [Bryobacteraceae bacterium]
MSRPGASTAVSVDRFFQFALLGLVASGYLAVAGSGLLDAPTVALTAAGLFLRGLLICGWVRFEFSDRSILLATLGYAVFFALDALFLSRTLLTATVHLVFFLAVVKILTARTNRDYFFTAVIAFLELLAAAILSVNFNFFAFLGLYLLFAMAALTSNEIRGSLGHSVPASRNGVRRFSSRLALLSAVITLGILGLTAGLFFLLPRTADAAFARLAAHRIYLPGFSNQVTLGEIGEIKTSSRTVMHVRIFSRQPLEGLKWRGAALTDFDGKSWSSSGSKPQRLIVEDGHIELEDPADSPPARRIGYDVNLGDLDTNALFFAGVPQRLDIRHPILIRTSTGSYRLDHPPPPGFRYSAYSRLEALPENSPPLDPPPVLPLAERNEDLELPPLDPRIGELAGRMAAGAATDLERARAVEQHLRQDYGYTLELPKHEVADPLADFLFRRKKGYCEYFASAMTVMLRSLGIPARLVTGFQSGVYNPISDLWLIRASDAHSWVEAWIPGYGWTTFDPTPPDPNLHDSAFLTKLGLYLDAAQTFWQDWVVSYDSRRQGTLADRMEQGARRVGFHWFDSISVFGAGWQIRSLTWFRRYGFGTLLVLGFGAFLWFFGPRMLRAARLRRRVFRVRRGQAGLGDATLLYEQMLIVLKRRGYQKPAWFTPLEFAATLPEGDLERRVTDFTVAYNALRFGGHADAASQLSSLLNQLEQTESSVTRSGREVRT